LNKENIFIHLYIIMNDIKLLYYKIKGY